ncbi:MAG: anti-anti-sigma factor [Acidovorax sp.]|nr:MAG: anti-anti-sigma factor [Acidovorax sp.]
MNKAVANIKSTGSSMADSTDKREQLSALADGQLQGAELADALAYAGQDDEAMATWELYHLVGDVLRSPELAQSVDTGFMSRLRTELAKEPLPVRAQEPVQVAVVAPVATAAANASVFRWKMAAGFASMAAVAAIGWSSLSSLQGGAGQVPAGAQLAQQSAERPAQAGSVAAPAAPVVAVADADGQQIMIRDPRLDELLAAHKQFGSTSALQMPAGFLRNATFETPNR